jgi:hypothetical protein
MWARPRRSAATTHHRPQCAASVAARDCPPRPRGRSRCGTAPLAVRPPSPQPSASQATCPLQGNRRCVLLFRRSTGDGAPLRALVAWISFTKQDAHAQVTFRASLFKSAAFDPLCESVANGARRRERIAAMRALCMRAGPASVWCIAFNHLRWLASLAPRRSRQHTHPRAAGFALGCCCPAPAHAALRLKALDHDIAKYRCCQVCNGTACSPSPAHREGLAWLASGRAHAPRHSPCDARRATARPCAAAKMKTTRAACAAFAAASQ